jgi:DNA-binding response OmpR family regulator
VTARLRALLRRVPPRSSAPVEPNPDLAVTIDEATGSVRVDGAVVSLSRRELEVLRTLLARPGRVVTRAELAGSWPALSADRRLDFVIRRLRQKLEMVDGRRRINSVRGVGFRFEEPDAAEGGRA